MQDNKFTNSQKDYFTNSFKSSKELEYNTVNICSILDSMQVFENDNGQVNLGAIGQLKEIKEEKTTKLELNLLLEKLKHTYLGDQQTYLAVIFSQLTSEQECKLLTVLTIQKNVISWTLKDKRTLIL